MSTDQFPNGSKWIGNSTLLTTVGTEVVVVGEGCHKTGFVTVTPHENFTVDDLVRRYAGAGTIWPTTASWGHDSVNPPFRVDNCRFEVGRIDGPLTLPPQLVGDLINAGFEVSQAVTDSVVTNINEQKRKAAMQQTTSELISRQFPENGSPGGPSDSSNNITSDPFAPSWKPRSNPFELSGTEVGALGFGLLAAVGVTLILLS
jgi:hypothetical protein